jgi:hypothetical protein
VFIRSHVDAGARDHLVEGALGELAVIGHRGHAKEHMLLGDVGATLGNEALDQRLHFIDMLGRARLDRRRQAAELSDIVVKLLVGLLGHPADCFVQRQVRVFFRGARVDLVVDIRDVAHIGDVVGAVEMAQQAEQNVENDNGTRVADMGEVIDRRPAHIHAHACRIERREHAFAARQGIVKRKLHRTTSLRPRERAAASPSLAGRPNISGEEKRRPQPA